jgi:hypothetical protein
MSLERIHLRTLLRIFYAAPRLRRRLLLNDIRTDRSKEADSGAEGGDFHGPFWADAKKHVLGTGDLHDLTARRIAANKRRGNLYPKLRDGFLGWWNEKRRWRNEPFELLPGKFSARYVFHDLGAAVKVENLLALKGGDDSSRLIYPYFSEEPELPAEGARLGLWLMSQVFPRYGVEELRILDILRGSSLGVVDHRLGGEEHDLFVDRYRVALKEWEDLKGD